MTTEKEDLNFYVISSYEELRFSRLVSKAIENGYRLHGAMQAFQTGVTRDSYPVVEYMQAVIKVRG